MDRPTTWRSRGVRGLAHCRPAGGCGDDVSAEFPPSLETTGRPATASGRESRMRVFGPALLLWLSTRFVTLGNSCSHCFPPGKWFKCRFSGQRHSGKIVRKRFISCCPKRKFRGESEKGRRKECPKVGNARGPLQLKTDLSSHPSFSPFIHSLSVHLLQPHSPGPNFLTLF